MKKLSVVFAIPFLILGTGMAGCSGTDETQPTKQQVDAIRHPTHIPPAGYKPPQTQPMLPPSK